MRVSVICPVLDTPEDLLLAAARSVLRQSAEGVAELLLVDDGCTAPATLEALSRLQAEDPCVRLLRTAGRTGPAAARNQGIGAASGDWIGFLDSDDLWDADHMRQMRAGLSAVPEARWICGRYRILDALEGELLKPPLTETCPPQRTPSAGCAVLEGEALTRTLLLHEWVPLGSFLVHRATLDAAGGLPGDLFYGEDVLLVLLLSTLVPMLYLDHIGYIYRRGHQSLMSSRARLSGRALAWHRAAAADLRLAPFRRELRWIRHRDLKQLALNTLLLGDRARALLWALRAYAIDPRAVGELVVFFRLMACGREEAARRARSYSTSRILQILDAGGNTLPAHGAAPDGGASVSRGA